MNDHEEKRLVLLPVMDGTGLLFSRFIELLPRESLRRGLQRFPHNLARRYDDVFKANHVPILYIQAEYDRLVSRASLRAMQRIKPEIIVKVIDGPHLQLQAKPKMGRDTIVEFCISSQIGRDDSSTA